MIIETILRSLRKKPIVVCTRVSSWEQLNIDAVKQRLSEMHSEDIKRGLQRKKLLKTPKKKLPKK